MKLSKTKLKQIIKEELEGSSRDGAINEYGSYGSYGSRRGGHGTVTVRDIEGMLPSGVMQNYPGAANILQRRALDAGMSKNDLAAKISAARIKDNEHPRQFFRRLGFEYDLRENKMKLSKTKLKQIIKDELSALNEGIEQVGDETVVTGPDADASDPARDAARLEDAIRYLMANDREDLAAPLVKIQDLLDMMR